MTRAATLAPGLWLLLGAAAPPVTFTPIEPRFEDAAEHYRQLWRAEGARIVAALEQESGLTFPDRPLEIILRDGRPMTGFDCSMIRLSGNATGPHATGTLIHELGHCLAATLSRHPGVDEHRLLNLFLYDCWTILYGRDFADEMVAIERRIPLPYDYSAAWDWALAMTRDERQRGSGGCATDLRIVLSVACLITPRAGLDQVATYFPTPAGKVGPGSSPG